MEDDSEAVRNLRETIKKRLGPSAMISYDSLVEEFTLDRIGESEMTTSLLRLLEKDEYLHQRFLEVTNELKEEKEAANGETQEDVVTDITDSVRDPTKLEAALRVGVKVCENVKEADVENRVNIDKNSTDKPEKVLTPSYMLLPEKDRSLVSKSVLNNEVRLVKVDTKLPKLTGYKKRVAEYEDDMYKNDMEIEDLKSAVERWENVMKRKMRIEDVEEKYYTFIRELDRGKMVKKLKENYKEALPGILDRLKEKLNQLKVTRDKTKSRWKQIESTAKGRSKK